VEDSRPATADDCEELVERLVRLEAESLYDTPEEVEAEVRRAKSVHASGDGCIGLPITDAALQCIRHAKTPAEILERCLK
jgi:hypothetical protein